MARQAFAGLLWGKQFYPLRRVPLAVRRSGSTTAPARPRDDPQRRLAAPEQPRSDPDARPLGVPLVRRLGPGLSLRDAGAHRPAVRQGPAGPAAARVVHAPERSATGVRVELLRCQPAGARLGGHPGVRDRRPDRLRVPGPDLPQAADQLHLVGEQQGPRAGQPVRGWIHGAGQHLPARPVVPVPRRRVPGAGRFHRVDGDVRAGPAGHRAAPGPARPLLPGRGDQVLRALPDHRRRRQRAG